MENQEKEPELLFGAKPEEPEEPIPGVGLVDEIREAPPVANAPGAEPSRGLKPHINDVAGEGSFGQYLKELRLRNNFTIAQIAAETKIKSGYLEALESENYAVLPQPVYVLGYVRKLCALYHVAPDRADQITAGLREKLEYELPEDISKSVIDHEVSEENERKMRQLLLIISAGVVLVVVVLVVGGFLLLAGLRRAMPTPAGPAFEASRLMELSEKPTLELQKLEVP